MTRPLHLTLVLLILVILTLQVDATHVQRSSRFLLQTDTTAVVITQGPDDGAVLNHPKFQIHFEAKSAGRSGFRCRLGYGGIDEPWHECTSPYALTLSHEGTYTFQVKTAEGGTGEAAVQQRSLLYLSSATRISSFDFPENNEEPARFEFEAVGDSDSISRFECQLDNEGWHRCTTPHTTKVPLETGSHTFRVRAVFASGEVDPRPVTKTWSVPDSSASGSARTLSDRLAPSDQSSSDLDSDNDDDIFELAMSDRLISLLILVFVLIMLFFVLIGIYKCCAALSQRTSNRDNDGGGSQLTSLESEVLSGGIDMSGFSTVMAASWPEHIQRFRYQEIRDATDGFAENGVLGEGGFGKVYRGRLQDGTPVAVKKLEHSGQQGDREFFVEVATLCRARHANILHLVGVCMEHGNRVCIFELMDRGSARSLLDARDLSFTWEARLKVALGAAHGLACLHESVDPPIVHRDLKSENILMNENFEARISDFGLCTLSHSEARQRHLRRQMMMTVGTIRGTFGYLAPEVINSGRASTKSDVYAFGVFLLELLTGRRPIETSRPSKEQDLVKWTLRHIDKIDRVIKAVDPLISCEVSFVQIIAFVELAASCLHFSPSHRPSASEAARRLEELMRFKEHPDNPKTDKDKMGELCLAPRLSETSGTIPSGFRISCPSEGELTPHAISTPLASTSSGRMAEIDLMQRRFQESPSEQTAPQDPVVSVSANHRNDARMAGPSSVPDASSP